MSVDVFGRNLKREEGASRGPPGIGYKMTATGQYDIEKKRLCNVADPQDSNDAVNLATLQRTSEADIEKFSKSISDLRANLKYLNESLKEFRAETGEHLRTQDIDIINLEDLVRRRTQSIYTIGLDDATSESSGGGAS